MTAPEHAGRVLDWQARFDPRSLDYRVTTATRPELPTTSKVWRHHVVLDQGAEGACVGFGCAGEAAADPVPVPGVTDALALAVYRQAQDLDDWPGRAYVGTSVLAGCLAGRARGWWDGFRWAKSAEEVAVGVVKTGPAIIGIQWTDGSYDTDPLGVLRPSGPVVGGHCLVVLGFIAERLTYRMKAYRQLRTLGLLDGARSVGGPCFVVLNSWGPSYGKRGLAVVPLDVMRGWVGSRGEFAFPTARALGTS